MARVRQRLVEKYGEERAFRMAETSRNLLIDPHLVINDEVAITIRYYEPVAPDAMDVTAWHLVPRGESDAVLATRLDSYLTFLGPGGFATPTTWKSMNRARPATVHRKSSGRTSPGVW